MKINFQDNYDEVNDFHMYEVELKAYTDFNIHVESDDLDKLDIYYRGSSEGRYVLYKSITDESVIDLDINIKEELTPKYIKLVSEESNPTLCEVVGEVEIITGSQDQDQNVELSDYVYYYDSSNYSQGTIIQVTGDNQNVRPNDGDSAIFSKVRIFPCIDVDVTYYYESSGENHSTTHKHTVFKDTLLGNNNISNYGDAWITRVEIFNNTTGKAYYIE